MSTRANIKIKDEYIAGCPVELIFYRHNDGYPDGTLPTLKKFMRWIDEKKLRDNTIQSAGWLIIIGHQESNKRYEPTIADKDRMGWKVGSYEPTNQIHTDIEYLYELDLTRKEIKIYRVDNKEHKLTDTITNFDDDE